MARHLVALNATVRWEDVGQISFVCVWDMHRAWWLVFTVILFEVSYKQKENELELLGLKNIGKNVLLKQ